MNQQTAAQMAHLVLTDTQADPSAKPKEPLFANAQGDSKKLDGDKLLKNMFNILHHFRTRFLPLTH